MAKLHIYKKVGNTWSKIADGDGDIDESQPFVVTLTSGASSVSSGQTYDIRQGQAVTGTLCDCTAVNGGSATFKVSAGQAMAVQQSAVAQQSLANFYAALDAVSKSVEIDIDDNDLGNLKTNNYALCFAKKVAPGGGPGAYNVVWQSLTNYLHSTTFSWTPQFSLFGTNTFSDDVQVVAQTNQQTVGLGQQCVLDVNGVLKPPSTGGPSTAVSMVNQYGSIHPGLSQISTLNGVSLVTPLYVAENSIVLGQATLTPIETVLVWFQQDIKTSTMFSSARSNSVEIDLTNTNSAIRLYQNQAWITP